ncbi:MAG: ice-binding family protein [Burkholderiales bacterium]
MRISKMGSTTLLLAVTGITILLAGCSGSDGGQTPGQVNALSAAAAPPLGTEQNFAVLGGQTVTNTGPTVITGDLGVSPGSAITGFPPGLVTGGATHAADAVALQAQNDTITAYNNLAGQQCTSDLTDQDLGGKTLVPGVYCFSSSAQLTGTLTLDAGGDSNAVWVFKTVSALTTASSSSVRLTNGGQACNVFWQIGSSAVLGTSTSFVGNILALTSIALQTGAKLSGRALARNGAVTLDSNTIDVAVCGVPPVTPIPPTLGKTFSPTTIDAGGASTLTITLSNSDAATANQTAPLIDTLPRGVVIAATPNAATTCGGGVVTVTPGEPTGQLSFASVTLTGGSIPANGSCTVTVAVTAPGAGSYINSLPAGALQTSNGNNAAPAVATLAVNTPPVVVPEVVPPTLGKAFSPATINAGGVSTLTITLNNANSTPASLTAQFIDTLPSGLVVVAGSVNSTCIESLPAGPSRSPAWFVIGTSTVGLTQGAIPANGSCTVTAEVTAAVGGSYFNSLPAGALQTSNGNNAAPAVATLTVNSPGVSIAPTLGKSFNPATINAGGVSTLTITLSNANATPASLTAQLIDRLPGDLVAVGGSTQSTCIESLTALSARISPAWFVVDTSAVGLTQGAIPANGSCTVSAQVRAPTAGSFINSLAAGALQTSNGNNAAPAAATLTVQ